jgi:hypothetical protein
MQYRLRTLLILLAVGPAMLAGCYFALQAMSAPAWAVIGGTAQVVFWVVVVFFIIRRAISRRWSTTRRVITEVATDDKETPAQRVGWAVPTIPCTTALCCGSGGRSPPYSCTSTAKTPTPGTRT